MKKKSIRYFIIAIGILLLIAILEGLILIFVNEPPKSPDEILIKDHVSVITGEAPIDRQPFKVTDDELVFSVDPQYSDGEVVVAGILNSAPAGFIRKVTGTIRQGDQYIVKTEAGVLTDVFEKAQITKTFALTEDGANEVDPNRLENIIEDMTYIRPVSPTIKDPNAVTSLPLSLWEDCAGYEFSKEFEYEPTQEVSVQGEVGFNVWIELEIDINHGDITFGIIAHDELGGGISVTCHADADKELERKELFQKKLPNFQFSIGAIPIVITNEIRADIGGNAEVQGSVDTIFEIKSKNSSGFLYHSKTNQVQEIAEKKYLSDGLQWDTESHFSSGNTANVFLHLITKLYDSTGADISVGIEGEIKGEASVSSQKSSDRMNYAGSIDLSIYPKLQGSIVVTVPIIDEKLIEQPILDLELEPLWEKHWDSGKNWKKELDAAAAPEGPELNQTYTTQFQDVNLITYPPFTFDYPSSWTISQEEVTPNGETVVLTNTRGIQIRYSQFANALEGTLGEGASGGSSINMARVDVSRAADSQFVPGYVQGTDHTNLGKFMVAKLKVTGELNMKLDSDFQDIDGPIAFAVLPESRLGTDDRMRTTFEAEFAFWYSSYLSFIASSPDGVFTDEDEKEVIAILSSFRVEP